MWTCANCNKAMWTDVGMPRCVQTGGGESQIAGLCRLCARKHDAREKSRIWKAAFGFLSIAAVTGYLCYSFLLHA